MKKENTEAFAVEVVVSYTCILGEGPVWDVGRKTISWIDIQDGAIHEFDTAGEKHRVIQLNDLIGTIALCEDDKYLAALKSGLVLVDRATGETTPLLHPEANVVDNRFNDGKCDPAGRFWVGSMSLKTERGAGSLYMIDRHLHCTKQITNVTISNGLAWSPDEKTFYYIDTPTGEVAAFDYNKVTGSITNKQIVVTLPKDDGMPDGMTIDTEGMLWIGHYGGWQVSRWNPATGEKLLHIPLPVENVTSCTFGGDDLQDLYITSAKEGLSEKQLEEQPLAGSLFVVRNCGFSGIEPFRFAGLAM